MMKPANRAIVQSVSRNTFPDSIIAFCSIIFSLVILTTCETSNSTIADVSAANEKSIAAEKKSDNKIDISELLNTSFKTEKIEAPAVVCDIGGHAGSILDIKATPDGKRIVTCATDGTIRVWDSVKKTLERTIYVSRVNGAILSKKTLSISPDSKRIAAGGWYYSIRDRDTKTIQIIDIDSGKAIVGIDPSADSVAVNDLEYSDDGKYLVSALSDGSVKIWDVVNKYTLADSFKVPVSANGITIARVDGDYRIFASGSGKIIGYSMREKKQISEYTHQTDLNFCASNGKYIAVSAIDSVFVLDLDLKLVATLDASRAIGNIAFAPDGRYLVSGFAEKGSECAVFDSTLSFKKEFGWKVDNVNSSVTAFLDKKTAVYTGPDNSLCFYDLEKKAEVGRIDNRANVFSGLVLDSGILYATPRTGDEYAAIRFNPFGIEKVQKQTVAAIKKSDPLVYKDYTLGVERVNESPRFVINKAGKPVASIITSDPVPLFGFTANGYVYTGEKTGTINIYTLTGELVASFTGHAQAVTAIASDETRLYSCGDDSIIRIWDLKKAVASRGSSKPLLNLCIGKDGQFVAWTQEGYYSASGGGAKMLGFLDNSGENGIAHVSPISLVSGVFDRPAFISSVLSSDDPGLAYKLEAEKKGLVEIAAVFENKGFYLTRPGAGWSYNKSALDEHEAYDIEYVRFSPLITLGISATQHTILTDMLSVDALADRMLAVFKSSSVKFTFDSKELYTINGQVGTLIRFQSEAKMNLSFIIWITSSEKYYYTLSTWSTSDQIDHAEFLKNSKDIFSTFNLIGGPRVKSALYESPAFGYSIDLLDSGWFRADGLKSEFKGTDYAALTPGGENFFVIPIPLLETDPPLNAVTYALLQRINLKYPDDVSKDLKKITIGNLAGYVFDHKYGTSSDTYRIWVTRSKNFAYLVIGFSKAKTAGASLDKIDAIFAKLKIREDAPSPANTKVLGEDFLYAMGNVFNDIGLFYVNNSQYLKGAEYLKKAFELEENQSVFLANYLFSLSKVGQYAEALAYLEKYITKLGGTHNVFSYLPFLQSKTGHKDEAIVNYKKLFSEGYEDDYDFSDYMNLLWETGKKEEALFLAADYRSKKPVPVIRRLEAELHNRQGEYDIAIKLLTDTYGENPLDKDTLVALLETFDRAELYAEGLAFCKKAHTDDAEPATIYFYEGLYQLGLKWYADAKISFEAALRENPTDESVKKYVEYTNGLLGEGENGDIRKVILPVSIPDELKKEIPAFEYAAYADKDCVYLNRIIAIEYAKEKEYRITYYSLIRINNQKGVSEMSTFTTQYNPANEGIYINSFKVLDEKYNTITSVDAKDFYILDETEGQIVTGDKTVNAPVKGLVPGNIIEVMFTVSKYGKLDNFPFESIAFFRYYPVVTTSLLVTGDTGNIAYSSKNAPEPGKNGYALVWTLKHLDEVREEPSMSLVETFCPQVNLGDKAAQWDRLGLDYLGDIKEVLSPSKSISDLAKSKVGSEKSTERKVEALARFVQKELTYKAILFGKNAWMPKQGDEILANKYGDCKDHALLLHLLLKSAGIKSSLALVNTDSDTVKNLPSMDQFNHMIVYLPDYKKGFFIDPTAKYYNIAAFPPLGIADHSALVLDEKKPVLVKIPSYPEDACKLTSDRAVTISTNGDAVVTEKIELTGYYGSQLRSYLGSFDEAAQKDELHMMLAKSGSTVDLTECTVYNVEDAEKPLVIALAYAIKGHFLVVGNQLVGKLPAIWEQEYLNYGQAPQRKTPFTIFYPFGLRSTVKVNMPSGYLLEKFMDKGARIDNKFLTWSATPVRSGQSTLLDFSFKVKSGTYSPSEFAGFTRLVEEALAGVKCDIVHKAKK